MAARTTRKQNKSATTPNDEPSFTRHASGVGSAAIRWLSRLAGEWSGAVEEHRKWINSERARALGNAFDVSGRLFSYAAYITLAWLAFNAFVVIRNGLAAGIYALPEQNEGSRVALFNILAGGLLGPIILIAIGIGIGWIYNLAIASAQRIFPRFVQPLVHPSILLTLAAGFAVFNSATTTTAARGYLLAKANIEAALQHNIATVTVIEIPAPAVQDVAEVTGDGSSGERELVRLRSMFANRPCVPADQGAPANPEPQDQLPQPGMTSAADCRTETPLGTNESKAGIRPRSATDQ